MKVMPKENGHSCPSLESLDSSSQADEWTEVHVPDALARHAIGRENQILSSEIRSEGRFPVLDQGQAFIAGYSDEEARVIRNDLPLIIFGDHTRCLKYVDFPFILGADGTKVLKPKTDIFNPKYFYFALRSLDIPNRGYNRHFTVLKEKILPRPPLPEQKKIVHILSTVQRAIEAQERIIATTSELKKALMHKLFTEGLRNEPQIQTEIGPVPESWEVVRIKTTGTVVTGSTPSTKNADFYGGTYNLISPADLNNGKYVRSAHKTLTKAGFEKCRRVPRDSILVGCIGNVGKLGIVADDCSTTNQQINSIIPNCEFNPHFLYYALQLCRPRLEQAAAKVTLPILNKSNFENFQIAAPERKEQEAIAGFLEVLDQKLETARQKTAKLQDLFRTLLNELMTAKTRVHELEITA